MRWFERSIRRYEHRRWTTDDNRRVQAFDWGLEYIGGDPRDANPGAYVRRYASQAIEDSPSWFATTPAADYHLDSDNTLTFTSALASPWPENNTVYARLWPARRGWKPPIKARPGSALLVLPNWNAKWHGQDGLCDWISRFGITALKMSMPYHNRRMARGHERADQICGPNIGLTLQANRQAVLDARRCLCWLQQQGYTRIGILGTSLGSSIGYITLMHDPAVKAGGFFHFSTYFADVVSQGMTTNHVWEGLREYVTLEELREFWAPISPIPYVQRGLGKDRRSFLVYGKYDPTMLPELSREMLASLREHGARPRSLQLPCGHYSLELPPFSYIAGYRVLAFLRHALAQ
jgi:hypothetical protein